MKKNNRSPFANISTEGIKNGDTVSVSLFRELKKDADKRESQGLVSSGSSKSNGKNGNKKKKKKKLTREEIIFNIEHNINKWDALYRSEIARLEGKPTLIQRDKEYYYQVNLLLYIAENYSHLQYLTHASPNGGARSDFEAYRLTCAGLSRGHPDVQVQYPVGIYHGIYIEMKKEMEDYRSEKVALSEVAYLQHKHRIKLNETGYLALVCYGFEEAKEAINCYMTNKPIPPHILNRWDDYDWRKLAKVD